LRELLADLRPNAQALSEIEELFGDPSLPSLTVAGVVSREWRRAHVLIKAKIVAPNARLARIEDERTLAFLRKEHASILTGFGIQGLRVGDVRTRERIITQQFSLSLYDLGLAGIAFVSRLDAKPCYALFEGRAFLKPVTAAISMTSGWPELIQVCGEYNLILRPAK
jgi:hypothetical protein